jgi:hypothetical protein
MNLLELSISMNVLVYIQIRCIFNNSSKIICSTAKNDDLQIYAFPFVLYITSKTQYAKPTKI